MNDNKNKSKKREFQVNVLGVPYKVCMGTLADYPILKENHSSGLCDWSVKKIWVEDTALERPDVGDLQNQHYLTNITLRHELLHAFFHESGLEEYASNENLVNFLAMSMEKIHAMCRDAGSISKTDSKKAA